LKQCENLKRKMRKKFDFRKAKIVKRKKPEIFGLQFFSLNAKRKF